MVFTPEWWWYLDFYLGWYNSLGVPMRFMHYIPNVWVYTCNPDIVNIYNWADPILYILTSVSGNFMMLLENSDDIYGIKVLYGMIGLSMIIGIILDYLILAEISDFYKRKNIQKSHNKIFTYFYILWRIIMPDIFVASTISALGCKITLSRKNIFLLSVLAQILRFAFILLMWQLFSSGIPLVWN